MSNITTFDTVQNTPGSVSMNVGPRSESTVNRFEFPQQRGRAVGPVFNKYDFKMRSNEDPDDRDDGDDGDDDTDDEDEEEDEDMEVVDLDEVFPLAPNVKLPMPFCHFTKNAGPSNIKFETFETLDEDNDDEAKDPTYKPGADLTHAWRRGGVQPRHYKKTFKMKHY